MHLVIDRSLANDAVKVTCVVCGLKKKLSECWCDLDGKPFLDYYCEECKPDETSFNSDASVIDS